MHVRRYVELLYIHNTKGLSKPLKSVMLNICTYMHTKYSLIKQSPDTSGCIKRILIDNGL